MARYNKTSYDINFPYLIALIIFLWGIGYSLSKMDEGKREYKKCIAEYGVIKPNAKGLEALGIIKECELLEEDVRGW